MYLSLHLSFYLSPRPFFDYLCRCFSVLFFFLLIAPAEWEKICCCSCCKNNFYFALINPWNTDDSLWFACSRSSGIFHRTNKFPPNNGSSAFSLRIRTLNIRFMSTGLPVWITLFATDDAGFLAGWVTDAMSLWAMIADELVGNSLGVRIIAVVSAR